MQQHLFELILLNENFFLVCRCPLPCTALKWGRTDADTCTDEPALPSPTMTSTAMYAYFEEEFGFNVTQVNEDFKVLLKLPLLD